MSKIKNYNSDCGLASGVDAKLQSTNRFISQKQQYVLLETHYFYCRTKTKIHKKKKNGFYCRRRLRFIVGGFQNDDHVATTEIGNSVPHLRRNEMKMRTNPLRCP